MARSEAGTPATTRFRPSRLPGSLLGSPFFAFPKKNIFLIISRVFGPDVGFSFGGKLRPLGWFRPMARAGHQAGFRQVDGRWQVVCGTVPGH